MWGFELSVWGLGLVSSGLKALRPLYSSLHPQTCVFKKTTATKRGVELRPTTRWVCLDPAIDMPRIPPTQPETLETLNPKPQILNPKPNLNPNLPEASGRLRGSGLNCVDFRVSGLGGALGSLGSQRTALLDLVVVQA